MKNVKDREKQPTEKLPYTEDLYYRVWGEDRVYLEDPKPWKCMACFRFLQECLDYIAYCQDRQVDVVFQSPADCKLVKHTDRRVVYKPIPEATGGDPPRTPKTEEAAMVLAGTSLAAAEGQTAPFLR